MSSSSPATAFRTCVADTTLKVRQPRLAGIALGMLFGALLATPAVADGTDVSADEIFSDDVTLTTVTGAPLDINTDGFMDLAVASNRNGSVKRSRYYLGNGDGTFSPPVLLTEGKSSAIVAADLNGDLIVDLVQGRRDLTSLLYLGDSAGVGAPTDISADTNRVLSVAVGDLDGDLDLDIVTGNGRFGGVVSNPAQVNRYYLNDGAGNFTGFDISADADDTRSIALADMDLDGDLDVIVGNDETTPGSNRIYMNQLNPTGTVGFAAGIDFGPPDDQTSKIVIGDLNNDNKPDIVTLNNANAPLSSGINRFFLNTTDTGTGIFGLADAVDVSSDADSTNGGALADFDGDGDLDLAVANLLPEAAGESPRNLLYLNQFIPSGTVSFAAALDISADEQKSRELAAGDIDGDGDIDIVVGNEDQVTDALGAAVSGRDRVYLNNGTPNPFTDGPSFTSTPTVNATVGVLYTYDITTVDPNSDPVTITAATALPAWLTLTVNGDGTATLTGTPAAADVGDLAVSLEVADASATVAQNFTITVATAPANTAPVFTSAAITTATEGTAYTYNVTATDPDTGATLAFSAPVKPTWLTLTDNGDGTATLSGTPATADVGDNAVSLQVTDNAGATGVQDFTITVAAAPAGNTPPAFTSTPITDATEGTAYTYDVTATDPDTGATLTITAPTLPNWLQLTDNGSGSATLTGTPAAGDAGDHAVSLQVSDGTATDVQDFTITVAAAPAVNNPPEFTSTAVTDASEGAAYSYGITASDADTGDTLTITSATLPPWLALTDNGDGTATLSGTPAAGDVGDHAISLQVSDGTDTAAQDFTISVVADSSTPPPSGGGDGGGGGSMGFLFLLALSAFGAAGKRRRARQALR